MKAIVIFVLFVMGFIFCCTNKYSDVVENFSVNRNCPDYLIQKGNELHLLNRKKARIPGINPIRFNNLEGYVEFLNWQRKMGIHCPVLYFQQTYDAQNNVKYRMLPDIMDKHAGLPSHTHHAAREQPLYDASHDDSPYNVGSFPGFDAQDQYVGAYTPLDKLYHSNSAKSGSPMDTNWGGPQYTRHLVKAGVYRGDSRKGKVKGPPPEKRMAPISPTVLQRHLAGFHRKYHPRGQAVPVHAQVRGGLPDAKSTQQDEKYFGRKFQSSKQQHEQSAAH